MIDELLYWLLASIDELIDDSSIIKKEEYKNPPDSRCGSVETCRNAAAMHTGSRESGS